MRLQDIREAIEQRLKDIDGVRPVPFVPDQTQTGNGLVVVVAPDANYFDYWQAFSGGLGYVRFNLSPYVQMTDPRSAFNRLDELLSSGAGSTKSIVDALMLADRTLGGVCADVVVEGAGDVRAEVIADGARYLTCDIAVRVLVGRT